MSDTYKDPATHASNIPVLGDGFQENSQGSRGQPGADAVEGGDVDSRTGKRRFWGLGKKKDDDKAKKKREASQNTTSSTTASASKPATLPASPLENVNNPPTMPKTASHPYSPTSPSRQLHSSSPAPPSPASSQIFERHVQEASLAISEQAPIPGHIATENHIPPVLDASTEAITNEELNPDNVEIVMHSAHQPAALTVTGTGLNEAAGISSPDDFAVQPDNEDTASNYGNLDSADVRRLSFISFADVVHAEHAHDTSSSTTGVVSPLVSHNRSPSPIRSPLSSQLSGSPIMSGSVSTGRLETSPNRGVKGTVSPPPSQSPVGGGELTIETMRQALRKTGSGDLSSARSAPLSATGDNEGAIENPWK